MNKNAFLKELKKLNVNKEIEKKIVDLLYNYNNKDNSLRSIETAKEVLKALFDPNNVTKDPMVPISFILDNPVGRMIIAAAINQGIEQSYTVGELMEKTGYTRQYLNQEIKDENLFAYKEGRIYKIPKDKGDLWLIKKGFIKSESYTIEELMKKTGYTRQCLIEEIKDKNLFAYKEGKIYKIPKDKGDLWLIKKGFIKPKKEKDID
ncbi:hypothetical protein [Clostridium botulinum]|uniref:hypothetical protein n=1 Tax=Clostridium botulinum TaxID=1491 RepID=UPI0007748C3B|nr:hypothetical protein [Clostridium botulinum]